MALWRNSYVIPIKVEAMDPDAAANGQVTYQIVRTEPVTASALFTIDKDTGYISTAAEIDRETYEKWVNRETFRKIVKIREDREKRMIV